MFKFFKRLLRKSVITRSEKLVNVFTTMSTRLIELSTEARLEAELKQQAINALEIQKQSLKTVADHNEKIAKNFAKLFEPNDEVKTTKVIEGVGNKL